MPLIGEAGTLQICGVERDPLKRNRNRLGEKGDKIHMLSRASYNRTYVHADLVCDILNVSRLLMIESDTDSSGEVLSGACVNSTVA